MLACRYFDGASSRAHAAAVEIADGCLRVVGDDLDRSFPITDLEFVPMHERGPARLVLGKGASCEFADREAAAALFARLGYRPSTAERLGARPRSIVLVTIAFVAILGIAYRWGIPFFADTIVDHAPRDWDRALGFDILKSLDQRKVFRSSRVPVARQQALIARFDTIDFPDDLSDVQVSFRRVGAPNAFALPGPFIVVTDELVDLAGGDDDALMTILAHEAGHVAHRDAMRQLVRGTAASLVTAWYLGDFSSAAAIAVGTLGSFAYSRAAEHDADVYALRAMKANDIPTHGAAALFRKLEAWRPPSEKKDGSKVEGTEEHPTITIPEYLSTHPLTDARIRLFETGDESVETGQR